MSCPRRKNLQTDLLSSYDDDDDDLNKVEEKLYDTKTPGADGVHPLILKT